MGIKDRFLGNSNKESDEIENPIIIDIQPSPSEKASSEAEQGLLQRMWSKVRKKPHSDTKSTIEPKVEIAPETKSVELEAKPKNRLQSIANKIFRKDETVVAQSVTQDAVQEKKPPNVSKKATKANPNKLKKLFSQLTQKEKEEIKTEQVIEEVEERLEKANNSGKIKSIFHKLVKSANPQDIKKITEKLPSMNRGPIKEIWPKIQSLFQMVLDPKAAWTSKALAIGSLLYLISPFDAIPDVIPIAGLTDDAAVIISVVSTLAFELSKYAKQSAEKGIEVAEELADIEVRKYNRIVKITLTGSIIAAILAIAVKIILKNI